MPKTDSSEPEVENRRKTAVLIYYMGWTATLSERWLDTYTNSDTDSVAELEYKTWDDACAWEFRNTPGYTNMGLIRNPLTEMIRDYESDVNSDTDSDAELDFKPGEDASQTARCHSVPADIPPVDVLPGVIQNPNDRTRRYDNADSDSAVELEHKVWEDAAIIPPGLVQNPPMDIMRTNTENDEYLEKVGRDECIDSNLHPPLICSEHQKWGDGDMHNYDNMAIAGLYPKTMDCLQTEEVDCLSHAVCSDSVCLINGPLVDTLPRMTLNDGGWWDVRIPADWPCAQSARRDLDRL